MNEIKPYEHDCDACKWVGWFKPYPDKPPCNVYICCDHLVVIRMSDKPEDCWAMRVGCSEKGPLAIMTSEGENA